MTYLIVGGSSGVGRALAERFARGRHALVLVSSDRRDTEALAADLGLRHGVAVRAVAIDLSKATASLVDLDAALAALPPLAGILLPIGANREDDMPGRIGPEMDTLIQVNYLSPCRIVEHCLPRLERQRVRTTVIGFSSVAAARGRSRNAVYSAAKRALESYFESLRHALAGRGVTVQIYALGFLDTQLAFAQDTPLPKAAPDRLAELVYRRRDRDFGLAYFPGIWRPLCMLLRALPWFVFRRLSF